MTLIVWTNLAVSLDEKLQQTANTLWVNVLDQIYVVSPLQPLPSAATTPSSYFATMMHPCFFVSSWVALGSGLISCIKSNLTMTFT